MRRKSRRHLELVTDPEECARLAGLRYVSDAAPGFTRRRAGKGWIFYDCGGRRISDPAVRARLTGLVIPPAWTSVWICPLPNGHIQASGRDAKGRKQYIYHELWAAIRGQTKYTRMVLFGRTLGRIRREIENRLSAGRLHREKVLALVVKLLDVTLIRIGNRAYAKENGSFGLTTLSSEHVTVNGSEVEFTFRGKSGKPARVALRDRRLARIIKRCMEIPGYELFQYYDDVGGVQRVDSGDVNAFLREISGQTVTAKDFRTWAGSVKAACFLREQEGPTSETAAKRVLHQAVKFVASALGNTPAVCRKYYIHPAIMEAYRAGSLATALERAMPSAEEALEMGMLPEELALLRMLESQLLEPPQVRPGALAA